MVQVLMSALLSVFSGRVKGGRARQSLTRTLDCVIRHCCVAALAFALTSGHAIAGSSQHYGSARTRDAILLSDEKMDLVTAGATGGEALRTFAALYFTLSVYAVIELADTLDGYTGSTSYADTYNWRWGIKVLGIAGAIVRR